MIIKINGIEQNVACVETMRDLIVAGLKQQIKQQIIENLINSIRIEKTKYAVNTSFTNMNKPAQQIQFNASNNPYYVYNNRCNTTDYYPITRVYIV